MALLWFVPAAARHVVTHRSRPVFASFFWTRRLGDSHYRIHGSPRVLTNTGLLNWSQATAGSAHDLLRTSQLLSVLSAFSHALVCHRTTTHGKEQEVPPAQRRSNIAAAPHTTSHLGTRRSMAHTTAKRSPAHASTRQREPTCASHQHSTLHHLISHPTPFGTQDRRNVAGVRHNDERVPLDSDGRGRRA